MTKHELFTRLKEGFTAILEKNDLLSDGSAITIHSASLTPEEAIGITERKDYPILDGAEVMIQAEYNGYIGQAFTSSPADYTATLEEIINADIENDEYALAIFIATMNAVMRSLGLIDRTVHCKNAGPELCARQYVPFVNADYGSPKILLVGYQPAMFQQLAENFEVRVLDLNPKNVGKEMYGVTVEHGISDREDAVQWADIILCTGSTLANGSIVDYIDIGKEVIFFGTTVAGAAEILGLKRGCFESA